MTNKEFDFSPELGNSGRKRPIKSFTLSEDTIKGLKDMAKFHPEINISNWVDKVLQQALKEDINPAVFIGYRKGFKPVTLMLRSELVDFINALILTCGHGLGMATKITPLTVGDKVSKAILNAPLFLAGDMTVHGSLESELLQAKTNTREMYKAYNYDYEDER
ncbi:MAG: hypothetical protein IJS47_04895 [Clostridia bacterium]|nr:hypothetical protein [Clostridia bacterium]